MQVNPSRILPLGTYGLGSFGLPTLRFLPPLPGAGGKSILFSLSDGGQSSCRPLKIKFLNSAGYFGNSEIVECVTLSVSIICSPVKGHILELAFCRWEYECIHPEKKKQKKKHYKTSGIIRIKFCKIGRFFFLFYFLVTVK